jgi:2-phosphoglycerate kinase
MNPDNNALNRTFFIGGPPRVGKTTLSYKLAEKVKGHVVSTDAIRSAAKKARENKTGDLFRTNFYNSISEDEWFRRHLEHPEIVVDDHNKEAAAFWSSTVSFCNTFCEDSATHIVEGAHLLPNLVSEMKDKPKHVIYVGNTNSHHSKHMLEYSKNNPAQDWMSSLNYSDKKIEAMANFVKKMSEYFKNEAEKYGFPYFEIDDEKFDESLEKICEFLLK